MKLLKYVIFSMLALILLFCLVGVLKPTVSYGHSITVDKHIEEAWAIQQDEGKLDLWLKGFKSIELINGETGTVGSQYKVVVKPTPEQPDFVMIETIKSIKEHDHITLSFDSDIMAFDQTTSFSENNGMTTIKTDSKGQGKGFVMKSMLAIMEIFVGSFQAQEEENFENLKKVIERDTTRYF